MQTDDTQRVERLEQHMILNTTDLAGKIERSVEDDKARFDKILGRPIAGRNLIDQLLEPKVTS